jgi:hypothetical protein
MPHLFTTETKNYRPLERRHDYPWEVLRQQLVRELGAEFASFLARPEIGANQGSVDWYVDSTGPAVRASDLSPDERKKLFERLDLMRIRIYELADRIIAPGRRDADKRFSDALRRATVVPDDERFVWSLGGAPVLVLWGMLYVDDLRSETEVLGEALRYRDPRQRPVVLPPPAPPPPKVVVRRGFPFGALLWLLFAALMGVIYYLMFVKCDLAIGPHMTLLSNFGINACVSPFGNDAAARRRELEERIRKAELDLARVQGDCAPPQPRATPLRPAQTEPERPPMQTPPPPNREDVCKQLAERGVPCNPRIKLQVSLVWKGLEDLDLYVDCPGGVISHNNKTGCSGEGYVDTNHDVDATPPDYNAIENAQWRTPPRGHYKIRVNLYSRRAKPSRDIDFYVLIKCGDNVKTVTNKFTRGGQENIDIDELDYPACANPQ